jgi:hypothetical protein
LDKFRQKRNISDYERSGMITDEEVAAMLSLAKDLRKTVAEWLEVTHPDLLRG